LALPYQQAELVKLAAAHASLLRQTPRNVSVAVLQRSGMICLAQPQFSTRSTGRLMRAA
jgi:hypothetical protein